MAKNGQKSTSQDQSGQIVGTQAKYKMIPVDQETYQRLKAICEANGRKQGAQVSLLVNVEWEKLGLMKFVPVDEDEAVTA